MNIIDMLLFTVVLLAIVSSIARGFFASMTSLIVWFACLLLTFWIYPHLTSFVKTTIMDNIWTMPLSFLAVMLGVGVSLSVLLGRLLQMIPVRLHESKVNKAFGVIPGFVVGILYAAVIAGLLLLLPLSPSISAKTRESNVARRLTLNLARIERRAAPVMGKAMDRSLNRMTVSPGSSDRVKLPFTVANAKPRPDLEDEMLQLINRERVAVGLTTLAKDSALIPVARNHSNDMFVYGYFSHVSLKGYTPFDRIRDANLSFLTAGENLALAQTLTLAHEGLMQSPGHRANILRPAFGRVGIGILDGGIHGLMITQNFRD